MTIVVFDRKGDLVECEALSNPEFPVVVLEWEELKLALLEPYPGMRLQEFIGVIVELIGNHLSLEASKRLLLESLQMLYAKKRGSGRNPVLNEWIGIVEGMNYYKSPTKVGQYRETGLFTLKSIQNSFGNVFNYSSSNMVEAIVNSTGCVVIKTGGLSAEMSSLLASLFISEVYETRRKKPGNYNTLLFVLEDALPLVRERYSYGGGGRKTNPLAEWSFMGRGVGIGFILVAQNFSEIAPMIRNNTETMVVCSSYGRDAYEVARHLSLTKEQEKILPELRPGQAVLIARGVWPKPVLGMIPEVK